MKKITILLTSALIAATVLVGCGGKTETATKTEDGKDIVTISVRKDDWGGRARAFEEAAVRLNKELQEKGENTVVEIEWLPSVGDDELVLQAQAGQVADVFLNSSVDIGWELDAGLIQPIDWVKDSEVFEGVSDEIMDIMYYDGHYMGVIQDMDASPVFISRKALEGIGWSAEEIDGLKEKVDNGEFSMSDLMQTAKQVMDAGLVEIGFAVEDTRFEGWASAAGYDNYNLEQNKLVVNDNIKNLYKFWAEGFELGVIKESIGDIDTDLAAEKAVKGGVFATFARTEYYSGLAEQLNLKITDKEFQEWFNENFIWTAIPSYIEGEKPASYSNPAMLYVGSKVDEKEMPYVQRYLELMMSTDLQVNHTLNSGKLPVTADAAKEIMEQLPFYADHYYMTEFTKVRPAHPDYSVLIKAYTLGVDSILTKGKTAEEAYELFMKDAKQNVPSDRIIFE